jgi:hypothetical protein
VTDRADGHPRDLRPPRYALCTAVLSSFHPPPAKTLGTWP